MTNEHQPLYGGRITQDPAVMVGTPVVKGTRIPVERVLAHLAENSDLTKLFAAFPRLTREDVQAVLAYAHALVGKEHPPLRPTGPPSRTAGEALLRLAKLGEELGFSGPPDLSARIDDELYGEV